MTEDNAASSAGLLLNTSTNATEKGKFMQVQENEAQESRLPTWWFIIFRWRQRKPAEEKSPKCKHATVKKISNEKEEIDISLEKNKFEDESSDDYEKEKRDHANNNFNAEVEEEKWRK